MPPVFWRGQPDNIGTDYPLSPLCQRGRYIVAKKVARFCGGACYRLVPQSHADVSFTTHTGVVRPKIEEFYQNPSCFPVFTGGF